MKNDKKLIIFKSNKKHFWLSCQIIEEQILKAFEQSDLNLHILEIEDTLVQGQLEWLKMNAGGELHLFFLSDILLYQEICQQIKKLSLTSLTFYFPIYGNMTMEVYRWLSLEKILKDEAVYFLGASFRSCQQIANLISGGSVYCLPYCFDSAPLERKKLKTIDLVYAGRITPQKNILELISAFKYAYDFNPAIRLHIAGNFHDRMFHLHGYSINPEDFKRSFNKLVVHPGIIVHGHLNQTDLFQLYSRSDYFISMSTYHDEDFGMSACQAACQGLGLILSDWGGHADYKENTLFVPVAVDSFNLPKFLPTLLIKILAGIQPPQSETSGVYYQNYFSYHVYVETLKKLMNKPPMTYTGQSELYHAYATKILKAPPFYNTNKDESSRRFYLSIYESYLISSKPIT